LQISSRILLCLSLLSLATMSRAQETTSVTPRVDFGVTYIAHIALKANTTDQFTMQGGSAELGFNFYRGIGLAGSYTETHGNSIGNSGLPLTYSLVGVGPRYRWHADRRISVYGEGLVGVASGTDSLFPTSSGLVSSATSFAEQMGVGLDYRVRNAIAIRVIDAAYVRSTLPNGTNNEQNILRIGAGIAFRFGR